ncbi:MAG: hypothetical protein HQL42_16080 [Alphaproteobacteria bacterium]|nr:hypothetical protein [Alphaproteobacteria bacterium]
MIYLKLLVAWLLRTGIRAITFPLKSALARRWVRAMLRRLHNILIKAGLAAEIEKVRDALATLASPPPPPEPPSPATPGLISVNPHNIRLYELFLRAQLAQDGQFVTSDTLYGAGFQPPHRGLILRHDVDYRPDKIPLFVDIERQLGIRSDIHVIVDESNYALAPHASYLRDLAAEGFCIGLHTTAPLVEDFFTHLRREIETFKNLLGFSPTVFSIHGPPGPPLRPPNWSEVRVNFLERIGPRLASFGFNGSHNISGVSRWIEDTGVGGEFSYLKEDWVNPPITPGAILGVLTHPCHWITWPCPWLSDATDFSREHPTLKPLLDKALSRPQGDQPC